MKFKRVDCEVGKERHTSAHLASAIGSPTAERIEQKSGIKSRRVVGNSEDSVSLVKELLRRPGIGKDVEAADLIIVVSESKASPIPPLSSLLFEELGLLNGALVLDLDSGCAGYVQALQMVDAFFRIPEFHQAVVITTDTYSKFIDETDRSVAPIFGDGASVSVIVNDGFPSLIAFDNGTDASRFQHLRTTALDDRSLKMNGPEILMFVKAQVVDSIRLVIEKSRAPTESIDYFFFHQASELVVQELRRTFTLSSDVAPFEIRDTGNLVSTSIPFLLSRYLGTLPRKKILMSGFGVGLTWATAMFDLR